MKSKGYFSNIYRDKTKKFSKIAITVAIIALIFIPTVIFLLSGLLRSNTSRELYMKVSLYSEDKLLYEEEGETNDVAFNSLVAIFDSILVNKKDSAVSEASLADMAQLRAVITQKNTTTEYKCYFSTDASVNYIIGPSGTAYEVDSDSAMNFFASPYSYLLYATAMPPALYTTAGETVSPLSIDWNYKNIYGNILKSPYSTITQESIQYNMSGALGLSFEVEPDNVSLKIKKDGNDWDRWNGTSLKELSIIDVETGTALRFELTAFWQKNESRDFYGTAVYEFDVIVRDSAEFFADKTSISTGDLIVVSCKNILDVKNLSFSSSPDIGYSPKFYTVGETVYAIIPFGNELKTDKYSLTFSYAAISETIDVELTAPPEAPSHYDVKDSNDLMMLEYKASQNVLEEILKNSHQNSDDHIFCTSDFAQYPSSSASLSFGYGSVFHSKKSNTAITLNGNIYSPSAQGGAPVTALNTGKVTGVGNSKFLGNYVIIDHGMGIRTIYGHLGAVYVDIGDLVLKSESIGRTGRLNQDMPEDVLIMCYIDLVPIDYTKLAGKGLEPFSEN